ncbi:CoA transferase [Roseomonas eburnea]|uniref:CoA transferase n=1 Tax=Neoroseomonas eburnea TaxID=1346889 RepID=A0A9X9XIP8_9PROT|nr:CoA transferase [Neoroseomonas eburnea]MBR0683584.1 CoA transferase [Neoroseomonas eburnea]
MTIAPRDSLAALWRLAGLDAAALPEVALSGTDPVLPSTFAVGTAAVASIAAAGSAAAGIHAARGGGRQRLAVDMAHALTEFRSEHHLRIGGKRVHEGWDRIAGLHQCGDGRWVRLHTNFPHHRDGMLRLLGCDYDRDAVGRALQGWTAEALETAAAEAGLVATMTRSLDEWASQPQGQAAAGLPAVTIERIGEAPPTPLPPAAARPLAGLRVLDLTRVIAGPVAGRTLAAHGAEVLHITGPHLPSIPALVMDTGRGKRNAALDLRQEADRARLRGLAAGADVFLQGYRPGAMAGHGFAPEQLAALRPGIVCVSLSAYGHLGPWAGRRGFDSLVQNANGINDAEAVAAGEARPRPLPCQAIDHASGYLLAFGAMAALLRRAQEGGSWLVQVSLAGTGEWIKRLGRVAGGLAAPEVPDAAVARLLESGESGFGQMTAVRHSAVLSETPARWTLPAMPLGSHPPAWLA